MIDLDLKEHVGGHCVSTVRLAVPHSWGSDDEDYWYETYIFPSNGQKITDWLEVWGTRYRTEAEALAGHAEVVRDVKGGRLP